LRCPRLLLLWPYQLLPAFECVDRGKGKLERIGEIDGVVGVDPARAKAALGFYEEIKAAVQRNGGDEAYKTSGYETYPIGGLAQRLIEIEELSEPWLQSGSAELRVALAEAWGELGNFDKAIAYYETAVRGEDASFKLKAVEQLANFRARKAVAWLKGAAAGARDHAAAIKDIELQLGFIEAVNHALGDASERLSLQGGCWKRAAQIHALARAEARVQSVAEADASAAVGDALKKRAERYSAAACTNGKDRPYPRLMGCNARVCEAVREGTNADEALPRELAALANAELPPDAEFWDLIGLADLKMSEMILLSTDPLADMVETRDAYLRAYRHIGSPVKLGSVFEQLDFYEDIFAAGSPATEPRRASFVALVRNLRDNLRAAVSGQSSG
jgi:tetratricopeptide (TPR) repeat protein